MESRVLFISPSREDSMRLRRMLEGTSVSIDHAATLASARGMLLRNSYRAVLTEVVLPDGAWRDVLDAARQTERFIEVIVTGMAVDARLWAEVLNLGGYDILEQPFSEAEVRRVLACVCQRIPEPAAGTSRKMAARSG